MIIINNNVDIDITVIIYLFKFTKKNIISLNLRY